MSRTEKISKVALLALSGGVFAVTGAGLICASASCIIPAVICGGALAGLGVTLIGGGIYHGITDQVESEEPIPADSEEPMILIDSSEDLD